MTPPLLLAAALAATIPLRNPFWPVGYSGEREPISEEPRFEVSAPTEEEARRDAETSVNPGASARAARGAAAEVADGASRHKGEGRLWIAARR